MHALRFPLIRRAGFTLVELLVSTALIALVMTMMLTTVDNTQRMWQRSTAKVSQFQASRAAFEVVTRRLSQATLNTYWRAYDGDSQNETAEFQFRRHSELHFFSGRTSKIFTAPPLAGLNDSPDDSYPGHAIFFQAPLGHTIFAKANAAREFRHLDSLLTGCGYFIEYGDDPQTPDFLRTRGAGMRNRFRLMELTVPSERLAIHQRYNDTVGNIAPQVLDANKRDYAGLVDASGKTAASWVRPFWMEEALLRIAKTGGGTQFSYARPLAENIVALVLLPKLARKDRPNPEAAGSLAPEYACDSWRVLRSDKKAGLANAARDHLLPPIVQVTVVAVDEPSAIRMADRGEVPKWMDGLFQKVANRADYLNDVATLEKRLSADPARINSRVFTADVVIRGSKWSLTP